MPGSTRKILFRGPGSLIRRRRLAFDPTTISSLTQWLFSTSGLSPTEVLDNRGKDTSRKPQAGRYYKFDGIDDNIQLNSTIDFGVNDFSFGAWVLKAGTNSAGWFGQDGGNRVLIHYPSGTLRIRLLGVSYISSYSVSDLVWTHIAVNVDRDGNADLYINGSFEESIDISAADGGSFTTDYIGHDSGTLYWESGLHSQFFHKSLLSASEIQSIYEGDASITDYFYKMDEASGTTSYDSSGSGNHGTITNASISSFHATDIGVNFSYQNEVGYSETGGSTPYIPRDESNTANDVLGNPLDFSGQVAYPAKLVQSNRGTFDAVDDQVTFGQSITSVQYSEFTLHWKGNVNSLAANANIFTSRHNSNNRTCIGITSGGNIFASQRIGGTYTSKEISASIGLNDVVASFKDDGTVNLWLNGVEATTSGSLGISASNNVNALSGNAGTATTRPYNGSMFFFKAYDAVYTPSNIPDNGNILHYVFSEGAGTTIYDVSGNDNHGTATNITEASFWGSTQDEFHWNIRKGFRESSGVKIPALADGSSAADGNAITNPAGNYHNGAETKIEQYDSPALREADTNNYWFNGSTINAKGYTDIVANVNSDDKIFADVSVSNEYKNILSFTTALTGSDLANVKDFVNIT